MSQKANHTRRLSIGVINYSETALDLSSHSMGCGEKGTPSRFG
jgi:hypothetical protein